MLLIAILVASSIKQAYNCLVYLLSLLISNANALQVRCWSRLWALGLLITLLVTESLFNLASR
ncbi:hypothetical protein F5Y00DRAFT_248070 [Daldinia vernicosa]|uniref:uncharacterized protein n=1 Tax=Daldinia vernicosa TaxID=114800 RepID=UPI002008EA43|nr:uncharacterized protein F5Y00DRAFT_248070 [Daldinia vernicosa]KAI0844743.1 hypothetical protein F5Y00DRAFT_248070 [Daldinia vernicosa]